MKVSRFKPVVGNSYKEGLIDRLLKKFMLHALNFEILSRKNFASLSQKVAEFSLRPRDELEMLGCKILLNCFQLLQLLDANYLLISRAIESQKFAMKFAIQLDESIDVAGQAQLITSVRYI